MTAAEKAPATTGRSKLSAPKPPFFDTNGSKPVHYGVLLFPAFQALDVFGPLDVFNLLSMLYHFPTTLTMLAKTTDAVAISHQRAGNMMLSNPETDVSQSISVNRTFEEQLKFLAQELADSARKCSLDGCRS